MLEGDSSQLEIKSGGLTFRCMCVQNRDEVKLMMTLMTIVFQCMEVVPLGRKYHGVLQTNVVQNIIVD